MLSLRAIKRNCSSFNVLIGSARSLSSYPFHLSRNEDTAITSSKGWHFHLIKLEPRRPPLMQQCQHHRASSTLLWTYVSTDGVHVCYNQTKMDTVNMEAWQLLGQNPCICIHSCFWYFAGMYIFWPPLIFSFPSLKSSRNCFTNSSILSLLRPSTLFNSSLILLLGMYWNRWIWSMSRSCAG